MQKLRNRLVGILKFQLFNLVFAAMKITFIHATLAATAIRVVAGMPDAHRSNLTHAVVQVHRKTAGNGQVKNGNKGYEKLPEHEAKV
ncbi:MAG TPA: hypothetical protein PKE07_05775 [Lacibacter sp.]|nr:hypothetical protein [Lacibacter sp.]HMO89038.1 hypothetical protein [Lacibacter sp.]